MLTTRQCCSWHFPSITSDGRSSNHLASAQCHLITVSPRAWGLPYHTDCKAEAPADAADITITEGLRRPCGIMMTSMFRRWPVGGFWQGAYRLLRPKLKISRCAGD